MMASSIFRDAFRSLTDRIRFGRPDGPSEWLAPDPRGTADAAFDAGFPATVPAGGTASGPAAQHVSSASEPATSGGQPLSAQAAATATESDQPKDGETGPAPVDAAQAPTAATSQPAVEKTTVRKTAAKKSTTTRTAAKKTAAKKTAAKKTAARKASAAKATASEPPAEQAVDVASADAAVTPMPQQHSQSEQSTAASTLPVRDGEDPWTEAEIAAVRGELLTEREQLLKEIADADEQLSEMLRDAGDGAVDDQADAGSRTFEREQEISLAANASETLAQVDDALRLLDQGGYGVCEHCGKPIGKLRLQAYPRATLCLACKEQEERR